MLCSAKHTNKNNVIDLNQPKVYFDAQKKKKNLHDFLCPIFKFRNFSHLDWENVILLGFTGFHYRVIGYNDDAELLGTKKAKIMLG